MDSIKEYCSQEIQYFKQLLATTKEMFQTKIETFLERLKWSIEPHKNLVTQTYFIDRERTFNSQKRKLDEIENEFNGTLELEYLGFVFVLFLSVSTLSRTKKAFERVSWTSWEGD
jgi:hypothetical protein